MGREPLHISDGTTDGSALTAPGPAPVLAVRASLAEECCNDLPKAAAGPAAATGTAAAGHAASGTAAAATSCFAAGAAAACLARAAAPSSAGATAAGPSAGGYEGAGAAGLAAGEHAAGLAAAAATGLTREPFFLPPGFSLHTAGPAYVSARPINATVFHVGLSASSRSQR